MNVYIFNPENDLALGIDCLNYTPSPHAAALHRDGELFPAWWASEEDYIVAPHADDADRRWLRDNYGLVTADGFNPDECTPQPWGWSRNAAYLLRHAGVGDKCLPAEEQLTLYRRLSHRRTASALLDLIGYSGEMPVVTSDVEDAMAAISRLGSGFVKSPWSGSGRGVFNSAGLAQAPLRRRIEGIIHRQGNVIIEKPLAKILDFAVLYSAGEEGVRFHGLSVFEAEARGMYAGNLAAPQAYLRERITTLAGDDALDCTVTQVAAGLNELLAGRYYGPLGVDMMVCTADDGTPAIMPCIEINLRRTMGFVAMDVAARLGIEEPRRLTWHRGPLPAGAVALLRPGKEFTPVLL
ncbi:MAG: hypothetical protein HDS56_02800 [Barnesiella sp.]|nr:hypothetical protein [Bacteroidales bacterium]MBD5250089.1 hypothetical protein [Barnesiella sp.]MBD5253308.1 hypothetical protein [Barnesiella sp.]